MPDLSQESLTRAIVAVADFLTRAGLQLLQSWGDFHGAPLEAAGLPGGSEQHVYLARRI